MASNSDVISLVSGQASEVSTDVNTMASVYQITTPCTIWSNEFCDPLLMATRYFTLYGTYLAFAIGIPGNALTCIILIKMKPFNSSMIWLIVLTVVDLINLLMRFIVGRVVASVSGPFEDWSCRLFYITAETCSFSSNLLLVGLTCERFIATHFPLKMTQWCTVQRSILAVAICLTVCLGQSMYVSEVYRVNSLHECVLRDKYKNTWGVLYEDTFQTTVFKLLPIALLVLMNCLIARRLSATKAWQNKLSHGQSQSKSRQQRQIYQMLMASSICFILCIMPGIIYQYCHLLIERDDNGIRARLIMMNTFAVFEVYNSAANFVVYSIAAQKFRSEILHLLTCKGHTVRSKVKYLASETIKTIETSGDFCPSQGFS
nr:growth hormone secretagogue receptor type 1-like [Biomphalaria glabrata]